MGLGLGLVLTATVLFWWTATDRLDLPKQAVLVVGALGLAGWAAWRRTLRVDPVSLGVCLAAAALFAIRPAETAARVEGLVGWLAACLLLAVARQTRQEDLEPWLARLGVGLAVVAWLQAMGLGLFTQGLAGFEGRRVVGSLGGPGHLGWTLALLLPWVGWRTARLRAWWILALGLVLGGLVLSGSRSAWVMALVALPFWLPGRKLLSLVLAMVLGCGLAIGLDALTDRARLGDRAADLADDQGTAAGRFYVWRVVASNLGDLMGPGHGPEGFQRRWPQWQRTYLEDTPAERSFRSDLRHAHVDPVEVACDLGLGGLVLGVWLLVLAMLRPAAQARWRGPALAALVAGLVGGLAAPILFFAPCLGLVVVCLGLRLGPVRRTLGRWAGLACLVAVAVLCVPLSVRLGSEVVRSQATAARARGEVALALERAGQATRWDGRNPRAWMELGLDLRAAGRFRAAQQALCKAALDLPSDGVVAGCGHGPGPDGALPAGR